jgi:hypothetical protein
MRVERRPYDFEICAEFPNARLFKAWEGGGAFKAERDGKAFIISDGRTIAEFLDESGLADRATLDGLVSVIEFDDEAERDAYVAREMAFGTDLEGRTD